MTHVRLNSTTLSTITPAVPPAVGAGISTVNYSQTKAGFTAGGGFEWMFLPNSSVNGLQLGCSGAVGAHY
jgi:hypothetical protein